MASAPPNQPENNEHKLSQPPPVRLPPPRNSKALTPAQHCSTRCIPCQPHALKLRGLLNLPTPRPLPPPHDISPNFTSLTGI